MHSMPHSQLANSLNHLYRLRMDFLNTLGGRRQPDRPCSSHLTPHVRHCLFEERPTTSVQRNTMRPIPVGSPERCRLCACVRIIEWPKANLFIHRHEQTNILNWNFPDGLHFTWKSSGIASQTQSRHFVYHSNGIWFYPCHSLIVTSKISVFSRNSIIIFRVFVIKEVAAWQFAHGLRHASGTPQDDANE